MSSPFERLPVEVFDIIATNFDLPDYQVLRLSSRQLRLLTFSTFAKGHFADLTTTLGSPSLNRLVNISNHPHLSTFVTLLDVRLLNHRDYKVLTKISRVGIFPPPKRFPKVSGVRLEHVGEEATLYDHLSKYEDLKCIVDRLARALRGFCNIQTVRFRAHHAEPLGWQSIAMPEGDQKFRTRCFQAVIDAITRSEVQLMDFSMAKGKRTTTLSKCANLPYPSLHMSHQLRPTLQHCFSGLLSLTISVVSAYNGNSRIPGWENGVSNFIATAPSIKHLALSLDRSSAVSHYGAAVVHSLALSCRLMDLTTLQLVNCSAHEKDLETWIKAHTVSLQQLILSNIRLLTGSWPSLWVSLKTTQQLNCARLASLEGIRSPFFFRRRGKERLKITLDAQKAEQSMSDLLDDLISACDTDLEHHLTGINVD